MNFRLEQKGDFINVVLETTIPASADKPERKIWFRIFDRDVELVLGRKVVEVLHLWRGTKAEQGEKIRLDAEKRQRAQAANGGHPVRSVGKTERDRLKRQARKAPAVLPPKLD